MRHNTNRPWSPLDRLSIFGRCARAFVTESSDQVPMLSVVELLGQCYVAT
jgi:hypothetical protein